MTDNTNTPPADDVLEKAKAAIAAYEDAKSDTYEYALGDAAYALTNHIEPLVAALETALARIAALEAQIARKPIAEFDTTLFDSWYGLTFGYTPDAQSLLKRYLSKRVHVAFYPLTESEDTL